MDNCFIVHDEPVRVSDPATDSHRRASSHLEVFFKLALATEGHFGVLERVDNIVHLSNNDLRRDVK